MREPRRLRLVLGIERLEARLALVLRLAGHRVRDLLPPLAVRRRELLEQRVLDQLIQESLQLQMADQMGMRISDNDNNILSGNDDRQKRPRAPEAGLCQRPSAEGLGGRSPED